MTKQFKADDLFVEIGSSTSRTASAASLIATPVPEDGFQVGGARSLTPLPSDHGAAGTLLSYEAARNGQSRSASWYPFPPMIGTLMQAAAAGQTNEWMEMRWHKGNANLSGGDINGQTILGAILDGFSLNIDRSGESTPLTLDTPVYVNRVDNRIQGTDTVPSRPANVLLPYRTGGVLIDFKHNDADTYGGDHPEILGCNINYQRAASPAGFVENSTPTLNNSWSRVDGYDLTLTVELIVNLDGYDWPMQVIDDATVPTAGLRLALTHPNADRSTTVDTLTAGNGGTQTINFADASEFLAGDVAILRDVANDRFTGLAIDSIATNAVDFDTAADSSAVAIDGSGTAATVENMGVFLEIPRLELADHGTPVRNDRKRSMSLTYNATLNVGESNLLSVLAYDHPETRI